jgi:hypothetical protein
MSAEDQKASKTANATGSARKLIEFVDLAAKGGIPCLDSKARLKKPLPSEGDRALWDMLLAQFCCKNEILLNVKAPRRPAPQGDFMLRTKRYKHWIQTIIMGRSWSIHRKRVGQGRLILGVWVILHLKFLNTVLWH